MVHGDGDPNFIPTLNHLARATGVSAYIGDRRNRRSMVHRLDTAPLYRLAFERGAAGARYHAVAHEGLAFREIAETIGRRLNVPVVSESVDEAAAHFGGLAGVLAMDVPSSSQRMQDRLGWHPVQVLLRADLEQGSHFNPK